MSPSDTATDGGTGTLPNEPSVSGLDVHFRVEAGLRHVSSGCRGHGRVRNRLDSYAGRACHAARKALNVDGVAIVVGGGIESLWWVLESTGEQVRAIDDVQFDLGAGPVPDVLCGSAQMCGAADLTSATGRYAIVDAAASRIGVSAVFAVGLALPLDVPVALELSRATPGPLPDTTAALRHAHAVTLAIANDTLAHLRDPGVTCARWPGTIAQSLAAPATAGPGRMHGRRRHVAAAVAEMTDRMSMSPLDSLSHLRARAFRGDRSLLTAALDFLEDPSSPTGRH